MFHFHRSVDADVLLSVSPLPRLLQPPSPQMLLMLMTAAAAVGMEVLVIDPSRNSPVNFCDHLEMDASLAGQHVFSQLTRHVSFQLTYRHVSCLLTWRHVS